ncbi:MULTISPECIES: hypothetical protein [Halomicrobium]|uniref:Uncharacterized protein n=1 Tax=Halomicrobium mukohataei TaxID=57705 RepID=A0A4D6KMC8_9EURY|nr:MULTISPECIES: hypothetical protein [Halomicrobium]QCD66146.1 hypothetical protein E5139_11015 [Halomicrobium mukohataei]QFR20951.1 hypothetical protein GBQ70_11010 [Halomicrobium sp. ZPS1]
MRSDDSTNSIIDAKLVGWGLITLGFLILVVSERPEGDVNGSEERSETTSWRSKISVSGIQGAALISILAVVGFFFSVELSKSWVQLLVDLDAVPAREFSPRLSAGIILGILVALGGFVIDSGSKVAIEQLSRFEIFGRDSETAKRAFRAIFTTILSILFFGGIVFVIIHAYSLIQVLITPAVVERPIGAIGKWRAPDAAVISLLSGASAAIITTMYIRLVSYISRKVHT